MIKTDKDQLLKKLYEPFLQCAMCPLGQLGRKTVVFGEGNANATLLFLGEGPGKEEDQQGRPFIGRSGKLLNRALASANINRADVYITNIVKCRPPNNRAPLSIESGTCKNILLKKQLAIIQPKVICTLGTVALEGLIERKIKLAEVRGKLIRMDNFFILPTYHPAYVLRNPKKIDSLVADLRIAQQFAL